MFGLNPSSITSGLNLTMDQLNTLLDFVSMEMNNTLYSQSSVLSKEYKYLFSIGDLPVGFECLENVAMEKNNGWINDEARNIFIDSVNLLNGIRKNLLPSSPPVYAVNVFGITPLYKYAKTNTMTTNSLSLIDLNFETKFKNLIIKSPMRSTLANVLHAYRGNDNLYLNRFYGNLHVDNTHYVSVFINVDERTVHTCDSLVQKPKTLTLLQKYSVKQNTNNVTLLRKWIAKSMSIIDYHLDNEKNHRNVCFGSTDMCQYDHFGIDEENSGWYTPKTTEYMYYHKDISLEKDYPIQHDSHNCGGYSL